MRNIRLDITESAALFTGKRRRDAPSSKSQSLDTYLRFGYDELQARIKRQKRRMELWDAKGGFTIPRVQMIHQ